MEKTIKQTPEHKITNVTIYRERVLVSRELKVNLNDKTEFVEFNNLSHEISKDTIRISCLNKSGIKISGIDIKDEYLEVYSDEKINELEEKIKELDYQIHDIDTETGLMDKNNAAALETVNLWCSNFFRELYFKKTNPENLKLISDFYKNTFNKNNANFIDLLKKKNKLTKQKLVLQYELKKIKRSRRKKVINCKIPVTVETPGEYTFYLTYIINKASWYPVYDIKVLFDTSEIEISYYGMISQTTGEDWKDVKTILSTTSHSIAASLPELQTHFISFEYSASPSTAGFGGMPKEGNDGVEFDSDDFAGSVPSPEPTVRSGINVSFLIKENQDLDGIGSEKKVLIAKRKYKTTFDYRVYAKEMEAAFIRGEFENTEEFPLLEGRVKIYHGNDYIGDSYLDNVLQGEKKKLSLGVDEEITVKREMLKHFTKKKTFSSDSKQTRYKYSIKIKNCKKENVDIYAQEVVPVSKNKEIKVNIDTVTDSIKPDYLGVLKWNFNLQANEEKELIIEYMVEYPASKTITGLI